MGERGSVELGEGQHDPSLFPPCFPGGVLTRDCHLPSGLLRRGGEFELASSLACLAQLASCAASMGGFSIYLSDRL